MKTTLLTVFALVIGISVSAQKIAKISPEKANFKAPATQLPFITEPTNPNPMFRQNDGPRTAGITEAMIGTSVYDLQSNSNVQNRIYVYPDGAVGATWTMGFDSPGFATDRGTGYNYFDGTTWGPEPTVKIEASARTGWPSYAPLGDGEMVVSHGGGLNFSKRATRGTGAWTTTTIPNTAGYTWARAIASNGKIHVISNTNAIYQGLNFAIVYLSSSDNGATWTTPVILPGMDATTGLTGFIGFDGFGGDTYSWATPKGDTIAFVYGDFVGGIWTMKSFDNGATWIKNTIYEFPSLTGTENPDVATFDDTYDIALDNQGKIHFVGCRYLMTGMDASTSAVTWFYYPYLSEGVVYWNEDMPQIDTVYLNNPDTLLNHGMWVGSMIDINGSGEIEFPDAGADLYPWGEYRYSGLSSMPQIEVDKDNNIFVSYSCLREDLINAGANPTVQLYRHLYLTSKLTYEPEWCEPRDLTGTIEHSYDECVWASMALGGDKLHFIVQVDPEPGIALAGDLDEWGDNYMYYITFPTFVSTKPVDISKEVSVSPNPATEFANVQIQLNTASKVEVNVYDVMGKRVMNNNFGQQSAGSHTYKINTSSLPAGIYIFNIQADGSQTTKKVLVN